MVSILFAANSLGGLGLVFGTVLGYASKKLHIEVDPRIPIVRDALPSANCGGCGYAGCDAYAAAVVEEGAATNLCSVGGKAVAEKISDIIGVAAEAGIPKKAFVKCQGNNDNTKRKYHYSGPMDCSTVALLPGGGPNGCGDGCLGLGSCVAACPFDSIHIRNGIAVVNEKTCTGCGICVKTCPKHVIELIPEDSTVRIACNSKHKGVIDVKSHCQVGCIACGLCERNCPSEAIKLVNNLPVIDFDKCTQCNVCVKKCPSKSIVNIKAQCITLNQ